MQEVSNSKILLIQIKYQHINVCGLFFKIV